MSGGSKRSKLAWVLVSYCCFSLLLAACADPGATVTPASLTTTPDPAVQAAKVDSLLRDLLVRYQVGGLSAARDYARTSGLLDNQDRVRFGLILTTPTAATAITNQIVKMGGEVYATEADQLAVAVNLDKITTYYNAADKRNFFQELAAFKEVRELKILLKPPQNNLDNLSVLNNSPSAVQAPTVNEGIKLVGADKWHKAGFKGRGITVGIIDSGFRGYQDFLGTALPAPSQVQFKSFLLGGGEGSGTHGVAVAEVVHSIAPEARVSLAAIEDEIGFVRAVQYFIDQKVQIIQISMGWAGIFPGDGTGKMAEKLDEARRRGLLPVVSSGNYGQAHWRGTFQPNSNGLHQFSPNVVTLKITTYSATPWVALRWQEPWNAPRTNLDLYIVDSAGNPVVSSRNEQATNQSPKPPTELAPFQGSTGQTFFIQVKLAENSPPPAKLSFDLFAYNSELENATPVGSIATPADARGAISVGAVDRTDGKLEPYSSQGPTQDGRAKPDFSAPTNVSSATAKPIFTGTSAAAPQLAGVAGLVWGAAPELNADQIAVYLSRNAQDIEPPGRDSQSGYGKVQLGTAEAARLGGAELLGAIIDPDSGPFLDTFQAKSSGLPDNKLAYYGKPPGLSGANETYPAAYLVTAPSGQLNWNVYNARSFAEFKAEITVFPPNAATDVFFGLIFWQQGKEDYYTWLISGSRYALLKRSGATWQTVINWSQDAALQPDSQGNYRLSLEATSFYVRLQTGETILQRVGLRPNTPTAPPPKLGGNFGFVAGTFSSGLNNPAAVVGFTNLLITPLTTR